MLSLKLVVISLHNNQAIAKNDADQVADLRGLLKIVALVNQDFCGCGRIRQQKVFAVEYSGDFDEAIIRHIIYELEENVSS